jgi:hypothetical protein
MIDTIQLPIDSRQGDKVIDPKVEIRVSKHRGRFVFQCCDKLGDIFRVHAIIMKGEADISSLDLLQHVSIVSAPTDIFQPLDQMAPWIVTHDRCACCHGCVIGSIIGDQNV